MNKQLFKKSNIDRVSSPEQLHDYVKVANPGLWMIISAIVVLLVGVVIWGFIGKIDTTMGAAIVTDGGNAVIYIGESGVEKIEIGMTVRSEGREYRFPHLTMHRSSCGNRASFYCRYDRRLLRTDPFLYRLCGGTGNHQRSGCSRDLCRSVIRYPG